MQTEDKTWECYLKVPAAWVGDDLQQRCADVIQAIYLEWRQQMLNNPDGDLGYYLLKEVQCEVITAVAQHPPPWHNQTCYLIAADGTYQTIESSKF